MKNLLISAFVLLSTNAFASKIVTIKNLSNARLENAAAEIAGMEFITHSALKKVVALKGNGKSAQEIRSNTVAQALHTVCPFFDDGVSIGLNSKDEKGTYNAIADLIDSSNIQDGDAEFNLLQKNVSIFNRESGVEVYSGAAGGNNTAGTVLGIYDTNTNEIAVFASTNCGSDD